MITAPVNLWARVTIPLCMFVMIAIGWRARRRWTSANDYLNASGTLSFGTAALAFLAYNCGSIEVVGMSAMAAQYGVQAFHFYWIGGIPGLIFMALVVLPIYARTGANSLPEYLGMRFGPNVRLLNAITALLATICYAGVALYTLAQILHVILGWQLLASETACGAVVLVYVLAGGVRGSIFTSVFQLFVMVAGLTPLLLLTMREEGLHWTNRTDRWHLWRPLQLSSPHAPLDSVGILLGLGFAISFSYWCTDFVMIQRALATRSIEHARKAPLLAGFGKMAIAFLVVLPGVAAPSLLHGRFSFDQTMPALMVHEYGPVLLALGAAALLSGLMAWLAGNVSGFCALSIGEIYRVRLRPGRSEQHYIRAGQIAGPVCLALAQLAAYITFQFQDMMEFLQLIAALFYVPVFAIVLCAMASRRCSERGAFAGICGGVAAGLLLQTAFRAGLVLFGSQMNANFYAAMLSFSVAAIICLGMRNAHPRDAEGLQGAVSWREIRPSRSLVVLSAALLGVCLLLNAVWW